MTHVLKTDLGSHGPPNPCDPADQEDVCKCKCMCIQSLADQSCESLTRSCWTSCESLFFLFFSAARARVSPQERRRWRGSPLPLRYLIIRKYTHALFVSFFLSHMQACARAQTHTHTHTHTHAGVERGACGAGARGDPGCLLSCYHRDPSQGRASVCANAAAAAVSDVSVGGGGAM